MKNGIINGVHNGIIPQYNKIVTRGYTIAQQNAIINNNIWIIDGLYFTHRKKITISSTYVDANLTDFPIMINIIDDADIGAIVLPSGDDIRFTTSGVLSLLYAEKEIFNIFAGLASGIFWVKVPSITNAIDTFIYIYYGATGASVQTGATSVWNAGYKSVWHTADLTTSSIADSTINAYNGTKKAANEPAVISGKINKAQIFDGSDDYIAVPSGVIDFANPFTLSTWVYQTDVGAKTNDDRFFSLVTDTNNAIQFMTDNTNQKYGFYAKAGGVILVNQLLYSAIIFNAWKYLTFVWTGAVGIFYLDGIAVASTGSTVIGIGTTGTYRLGARGDGYDSTFVQGMMDEVRISSVARSADWVKFEYYNMNEVDNCLTFGGENL